MDSNRTDITVIDADRVIDGCDDHPRELTRIVMRHGVIEAIGAPSSVGLPTGPGVKHYTVPTGNTLLPGLIDTHTHLTMNGATRSIPPDAFANDGVLLLQAMASAKTHLAVGVTTIVDAGARGQIAFDLRTATRMGFLPAPRLFVAGRPITRTGGHAWPMGQEADGETEVRRVAREMLKSGADFLKVMATGGGTPGTYPHRASYTVEELRVVADEAHENGKLAVAHCSATEGHRRCLAAGIDILYHGHFYDPDASLRYDPEVAKQMADSPIYLNPTLWVNGGRLDVLEQKAAVRPLTDDEQRELESRRRRYGGQKENVAKLVDLGVKLIAGTDAGFALYPFGDIVTELREMVRCGMSPMAAILSATSRAADAFRLHGQVGRLTPGLSGDLLIVAGDPTTDIEALRSVKSVVAGGAIVRNDAGLNEVAHAA